MYKLPTKQQIEPLIDLLRNTHNPLKAREISAILNISERELRATVNYIRSNITPRIISSNDGYHWETNREKIINGFKRIHAHAISELTVIKKQQKLLAEEIF